MITGVFMVAAQLALCQDTGSLSGKVIDAITKVPIPGAQINVHFGPGSYPARSLADGTYQLDSLPLVRGFVIVTKTGYTSVGSMLPPERVAIEIQSGRNTRDFELMPGSRISGLVVDADSEKPVAGMAVLPSEMTYEFGRKQFTSAIWAAVPPGHSAAKGEFDISGLKPGSYVLEIQPPSGQKFTPGNPGEKPLVMDYGTVFYRDSTRMESALPVTVAAGERRPLEIRLRKKEQSRIAGSVQVVGEPPDEIQIHALLFRPGSVNGIAVGRLPGPGEFYLDEMPEGEYLIFAKGTSASGVLLGKARVSVGAHETAKVKLVMQPGIVVHGAVHMEDQTLPPTAGMTVLLMNADGRPVEPLKSEVSDKGDFRIENVPLGEYHVALTKLPAGYAVLHDRIDMNQNIIDVVITHKLGSVIGKAAPNTRVLLTRDGDDTNWSNQVATSDDQGAFSFTHLVPGHYTVDGRPVEVAAGQAADAK